MLQWSLEPTIAVVCAPLWIVSKLLANFTIGNYIVEIEVELATSRNAASEETTAYSDGVRFVSRLFRHRKMTFPNRIWLHWVQIWGHLIYTHTQVGAKQILITNHLPNPHMCVGFADKLNIYGYWAAAVLQQPIIQSNVDMMYALR